MARVCIAVSSLPWLFGPYQHQAALIGKGLAARGHTLFWLPTSLQLDEKEYSSPIQAAQLAGQRPPASDTEYGWMRLIGTRFPSPPAVTASHMNRLLQRFNIDR